jgi:L-iditol 2-dehydrogenase
MGHEWSGVIVEVGDAAKGYELGMRVSVIEFGGYAEYVKIAPRGVQRGRLNEKGILPMPDHMTFEEATFAEPFADCIHSLDMANVRLGDTLMIFGAGQMGLQHAMIAALRGIRTIVADVLPDRLALAKEFGAGSVVDARGEDLINEVKELTDGKGPEGICITAPAPECIEPSMRMVQPGGAIVLFSGFKNGSTVTFDPNLIHYGELNLCGSYVTGIGSKRDHSLFPRAIEIIASGKAPVGKLVTHRFPLEELETALRIIGSHEGLKAMIHFG